MKALVFILTGLFFLSLVSGASYPSPFTSDNTATVYGSDTPNTDIPVNLNTNIPTTPSVTSAQTETDKQLFSKEEVCQLMKGCWTELNNGVYSKTGDFYTKVRGRCFPYGYRIENRYCNGETKYPLMFANQSYAGENCSNSFECKSNFCFNGECIDTIKTIDEGIVKIDKSDLEELKSIIEGAENSMGENYNEEVSKNFFVSLIGLFKKMFNWW